MASSPPKPSVLSTVRRLIIGPWPIHGLPVWILTSAMILGVLYRFAGPNPLSPQSAPLATRMFFIVAAGVGGPGLVVLPLILYRRVRVRLTDRPVTSLEYLLSLFVASSIAAALLSLIMWAFPSVNIDLGSPPLVVAITRFFVPVWFLNALLAASFERIRVSSQIAQDALKAVTHQRRLLLESDERVRGQVAAYLHDRVQTDLVSIGLRIRAVIERSPESVRDELTATLADIERVRSQEVRRASRHLSPDILRIGLETALRELTEAYRPGMSVTIVLTDTLAKRPTAEPDVTRATAIYRICEQALLNAAIHGHASECSIVLTEAPAEALVLHIQDNGIGCPRAAPEPGTGMTVISAWVESLDGNWSLTNTENGMLLTAALPRPSDSNRA